MKLLASYCVAGLGSIELVCVATKERKSTIYVRLRMLANVATDPSTLPVTWMIMPR